VNEPSIAIIVLSWNGKNDTLECLRSLKDIEYPNYNILVVDNGSKDGTPNAVKLAFPDVEVLETGENLGFAKGNNVGIQWALDQGAEAILLLNNDTIVDPSFLSTMVESLYSEPDIGATNPLIYYYNPPNVIWSAGGTIDSRTGIAYQRHINEPDTGQITADEDIDYGIGAALLIRREAIEKVGLLDPDFFLYYEETDWCSRARAAGYRIVLTPKSKIWHKVSRAMEGRSSMQLYYFCRNRLHFLRKRKMSAASIFRVAAIEFGRMSAAMTLRGNQKSGRAVMKAVFDFYWSRMGKARI
jgi:GT2 family glycosyltransferase